MASKICLIQLTEQTFDRWNSLKTAEHFHSDSELAEFLMISYFKTQDIQMIDHGSHTTERKHNKKRGRPRKNIIATDFAATELSDKFSHFVDIYDTVETNIDSKESNDDKTHVRQSDNYHLRKMPKKKTMCDYDVETEDETNSIKDGDTLPEVSLACSYCMGHHDTNMCNRYCRQCSKVYANKYVYKNHINTLHRQPEKLAKHRQRSITCNYCAEYFTQERYLLLHKARFHGEGEIYKCNKCRVISTSDEDLEKHMAKAHSNTPFACECCKQVFSSQISLKQHKLCKHPEQKYICDLCGKVFSCLLYLKNHKTRKHTVNNKRYTCSLCRKSFKLQGGLTAHFQSVHQKIRFQCGLCQKMYASKALLTIHIDSLHGKQEEFNCEQCGKFFLHAQLLKLHIHRVHGMKRFKCNACPKTYKTNCQLKNHVLISHDNIKQYQCGVCSKLFGYKYHAVRHLEQVHRESMANSVVVDVPNVLSSQ